MELRCYGGAAERIGSRLKNAISSRDSTVAEMSMPASEEMRTNAICCINMQDLRAMQRKYGLRGHRTKASIAEQILRCGSARDEVETMLADNRRRCSDDANSNVESLTEQMRDIWERLGRPTP